MLYEVITTITKRKKMIKVLIADDHQLFREGLTNLLKSADDIRVIAQAEDGEDAIDKVSAYQPDVLLIDIAMKNMNGIEATKLLKKKTPELKIIAVSMHSDKQYVKGMLEAGADGYLLKNCTYRQLTDAIYSTFAGKKFLSEDITEIVSDVVITSYSIHDTKLDEFILLPLSKRYLIP